MSRVIEAPARLRRALLLDAVASGGLGLLLLVGAPSLAPVLGLSASLLRGVGIFLLPFALSLMVLAPRAAAYPSLVRVVVLGNVVWVVASLALSSGVGSTPTMSGEVFVIAQAAAVAVFAYLEHGALRDHGRGAAVLGSARP